MPGLNNFLGNSITGAGVGSAFGPWGTAIGGLLGGVGGLLGLGASKPASVQNHPLYNPQQMGMIQQLLQGAKSGNQQALNYLQQLLSNSPEATEAFEQPYLQNYERNTVPHLAERFSGLGARSSSGFNQAMSQGGQDLQMQLAALRGGLKNQAIQQLQGYNQQGLQHLNQPYVQQGQTGLFESIAPYAGNILGNLGNRYAQQQWGI